MIPTSTPLSELRRSIASGQVSPAEVVAAHRDRAHSQASRWDAFTELTTEGPASHGPLRGVPVAVKDAFVDGGRIPTMGSRVHPTWLSGTAEVIRRLRAEGATILGYTNLHEWAIGTTSVITATGPIRNPWDLRRIAGGSSGGSAVAVAAGLAPVAIGTDAGGSTRIPAACCGIVGFKPTFAAIPLDGEPAAGSPLNSVGVFARNVADVSKLFSLLSGKDVVAGSVGFLGLGIPHGFFYDEVEPEVASVVDRAATLLGSSFARVRGVSMPGVESAGAIVSRRFLPFVAGCVADRLAADPRSFEPPTRRALELGLALENEPDADPRPVLAAWDAAFDACDVVAVPTLPGCPPLIDEPKVDLPGGSRSADLAQIALNAPMNVAGLPALSLPCGEVKGLATGITLVGRKGADALVLAAGDEMERLLDGAFRDRVAPSGGINDPHDAG